MSGLPRDIWQGPLGATPRDGGPTRFLVWAPEADAVLLRLGSPARDVAMVAGPGGYFAAETDAPAGTRYAYSLDDGPDRADPASRSQPDGPHGPSEVVSHCFPWTDAAFRAPPLDRLVIYELHVGTFTPEGTFDAVIPHLDGLRKLGVTAVELMPIAQFPGPRNWGYDGVLPFAAQGSYGGVDGLRRLIDAAHARGLAAVLDVVYNHLGPEGNHLAEFGPYFTGRYPTPWGPALNFGEAGSDEVRRYFIENALWWIDACHVDALRLDAVHAIIDPTPLPFIRELAGAVHRRARERGLSALVIAESAANDSRLITPAECGGLGADAQWNDDFHHALRTLVTGDRTGYYADFGALEHLHKAMTGGFVLTGGRSTVHGRRHGSPSRHLPAERFVVFGQNHDHVGNRPLGERLNTLVTPEKYRLAAAACLLAPAVPLLFMGEEYAEPAPFLYFVSHTDPELVAAVRRGRAAEFAAFHEGAQAGAPPDPQGEEAFLCSKLAHGLKRSGDHARTLAYYAELLRLRRETPALATLDRGAVDASRDDARGVLTIRRRHARGDALLLLSFADAPTEAPLPAGAWRLALASRDPRWGGASATENAPPTGVTSRRPAPIALPAWSAALYLEEPAAR